MPLLYKKENLGIFITFENKSMMDVIKTRPNEGRLVFLIKKVVQLNEVKNNKLELANFLKNLLKFCKFWIDGEISYWSWIRGYIIFFMANSIMLMAVPHLIRHLTLTDKLHIVDVSTDIALIVSTPMVNMLFHTFYRRQKQWAALLIEMGNFEVYEKPDGIELIDMRAIARMKLTLFIILMPIPFLIYYFLSAQCADPTDTECGFLFPLYFPGCMNEFRPFCALIQLGTSFILSSFGYTLGSFYSQLSEYIVIYLRHFQELLTKIPLISNWDERWIHVHKTMEYHQRILNLYELYFRLVKNVFLVHVFGTPVILALLMSSFMMDFRVQNLAHALLWALPLVFVCYFGQNLVDESNAAVLVAYQSIPFDGDQRTAKALLFLIHRAQKTLHIPAGSLTYCGYDLFVAVCKTMYSYLTVINSTDSRVNK